MTPSLTPPAYVSKGRELIPPFRSIPTDSVIISRHHEWAGGDAKSGNTVVCLHCRVRVTIGDWPAKNCTRKIEFAHSGYGGVVVRIRDGVTAGIIGRFNRVGRSPVRYRRMAPRRTAGEVV